MPSPKYMDFAEYILGVTETIWEGRNIASLRENYSDDIPVRSPLSLVVGNEAVISATLATLSEFPDRELLGEDVIWDRMGEDSWLSSHRIISLATHAEDGFFGWATQKRLSYRIIADCHASADPKWGWQINDEWLVRDLGAIVRQIGRKPSDFARELIGREGGYGRSKGTFIPGDDEPLGPYKGKGNDAEPGLRYADMLDRIMNADVSAIKSEYDRACQIEMPGGLTGHGWSEAEKFWLGLRASFPNAAFRVEHRMGREDERRLPRAAVRWSLTGKHDGWGAFDTPSQADVHVMGMSHAEYGPRGLIREFTLYDEVAVWKQILENT